MWFWIVCFVSRGKISPVDGFVGNVEGLLFGGEVDIEDAVGDAVVFGVGWEFFEDGLELAFEGAPESGGSAVFLDGHTAQVSVELSVICC